MDRLARFVIRHRLLVALSWLVLMVAGAASAGPVSERLSFDFSLPGQPGDDAERQLQGQFGVTSFDTYIPVVTVPDGTVADRADDVAGVFEALAEEFPEVELLREDGLVTDDGRSAYALVQGPLPPGFVPVLGNDLVEATERLAADAGLEGSLTSYGLLSAGESDEEVSTSVLVETLIGGLGALAVLVFVFASFLALVPLLIAAVSILTTFLLVLGLTTVTDVSFIVQFLISLVGLGVAIDYSLLLVSRWREERAHGLSNDEAVVVAVRTAGHAVLASGVTVAISLLALVVLPVPFLRSMGLGGMLIPLVSVAVVLTLLPALLSKVGPRVDWPRIRKEGTAARGWSRWARLVVRRRFVAAGVAVVALGLLSAPVLGLAIGQSSTASLSRGGPAFEALSTLTAGGVGTGVTTPVTALVPTAEADAAVAATRDLPGVSTTLPGADEGGTTLLQVVPADETVDSSGIEVVERVRGALDAAVDGPVGITGAGAAVEDYASAVYDGFPLVLTVISLITFVLLVRTFRSLLLPLKAVLLNLVSLAAVFGTVVFFWQEGNGSGALFDTSATGAVTFWLPILIFAFLFGLSMDYEVFILARMREEYDATGSTSAAVVTGIGRTGRLVTSAALILFFAFIALATSPGTDIKVLGTALGVGILIDATLVRALLVPALVSAFGRYNWWLPAGIARVLRVEPSPLPPRGDDALPPLPPRPREPVGV